MSHTLSAIIIGSGVAGLASATRLAMQGFEVTVFEKNNYPGGKVTGFQKNGYHFDAGAGLFVQPQNIEELFALCSEPVENYFQYQPVNIACRYFYEDNTVIDAFTDVQKFAEELHQKTGEDAGKVRAYLQKSEHLYKNVGNIFLNYSLHKKSMLIKAPLYKAITSAKFSYLFNSLNEVNKASFTKPHTVQLFNNYATYSGSNPYKAPAMLMLIPHLEYNEGVYYPKGGMISITNALYKLAVKKGVQFYFDTPAQRIIYNENKVLGIVANEQNFYADAVVSNIDVYFTYKNLLLDERKANKISKQERSSSAVIFYWGIKKEFKQLKLHNIFFSKNHPAEFNHLFSLKKMYADPTVYINITSKCEPGYHAPLGKENWFVLVNAPANTGQDWQAVKQQIKKAVIEKLNRILQTDIQPLIEEEEVLDPVLIESRTSSYMGSLYGASSNQKMAAFFRHPNFSNAAKRLYFAGGSVHPGGGIPLCLKSAKIMSKLVADDRKKWMNHSTT